MKAIAEQNGATFILVVIPMLKADSLFLPKDVPGLFEGMEYFIPPVSTKDYIQRTDGHYNDRGHAVHATFIDSLCPILRSKRFGTF